MASGEGDVASRGEAQDDKNGLLSMSTDVVREREVRGEIGVCEEA